MLSQHILMREIQAIVIVLFQRELATKTIIRAALAVMEEDTAAPRITADTVEVTAVTCVMEVMAVILATFRLYQLEL